MKHKIVDNLIILFWVILAAALVFFLGPVIKELLVADNVITAAENVVEFFAIIFNQSNVNL